MYGLAKCAPSLSELGRQDYRPRRIPPPQRGGYGQGPFGGSPFNGLGWLGDVLDGLGATPAQRRAAALARRQKQQTARAAKKAARVAGRNVATSRPDIANRLNSLIAKSQSDFKSIAAQANRVQQTIARARAVRDPRQRQSLLAQAKRDTQRVLSSATPFVANIKQQLAPVTGAQLRALGMIDPNTGVDDGSGYIDPGQDIYGGGADPYAYAGGGVTPSVGIDPTSLTPGFGSPFGSAFGSAFGSGMPAPSGCRAGSNLPRCLIYQMAVDERQQFMFVFSILQQMYAQLLQIVQQLLYQLQGAQQQPGYPYSGYGPTPYGDPYGGYGGAGPYPSPYGYPGIPYSPGGDIAPIPSGYDSGGDPFGGGDPGIPGDVSQIFPGPRGPLSQGPDQPGNIISSDSLPFGAGPDTGSGGDEAPVPGFTPASSSQVQAVSQPVNAGPSAPQVIIIQQPTSGGQSPYADALLPAGNVQDQPSLEPPGGDIEGWARNDWA